MRLHDTIVAASSPPGRSHRGLIRLSGPDTRAIVETLIDEPLPPPRMLVPRCIGSLPILLAYFRGPASYTGQDMAELQLPGNAALLDRVLHRVITSASGSGGGARLAEPGEFTFRAFAAGKMDLTEAEGIAATIAAAGEGQLRAAALLRRGQLGHWAQRLVERLADHLALVEAGIDFTDQESVIPITPGRLDDAMALMQQEVEQLLSQSRSWATLEALPRVVLAGRPSAGKSTLFNALLGRQRAVVSDVPGTTRDVISEPLRLQGNVEVMLVDVAGLDDPIEALDHQVQNLARAAIDSADLILNILDATRNDTPAYPGLTVHAKCDLICRTTNPPTLAVSALTGRGLDDLRRAIANELAGRTVSVGGETLSLQPRHESALRLAGQHLADARHLLQPQRDHKTLAEVELVADALRGALDALAGLGGRISPDEVIGRVFANFCVGK